MLREELVDGQVLLLFFRLDKYRNFFYISHVKSVLSLLLCANYTQRTFESCVFFSS